MTTDTGRRAPDETGTPESHVDADDLTLAYLRVLRADQRRRDRRGTLFVLYATLLTGAIWLGPYLIAAGTAARDGSLHGPLAERALAAVPAVLPRSHGPRTPDAGRVGARPRPPGPHRRRRGPRRAPARRSRRG
ncbi:hypothetical protein H3146_27330, partial [Streptomyces sp. OF3]|nr:hypothetical protein [Streptomyces alkaliterrae]